MAEVDENQFSLMSLEDELTCSICLSPFDCPVTIPCGHNFCQDCLLTTWKNSYSCPQCRTVFPTRPELKKNTVISTIVNTLNLRSNKSEAIQDMEESKEKETDNVIRCDTCMEAEEHLRPHRENPKFSAHQLCDAVGDLSEHLCLDHHKLIEFYCSEHGRPICSLCLQQKTTKVPQSRSCAHPANLPAISCPCLFSSRCRLEFIPVCTVLSPS
uniref:RING-type domain-containing protein n=1 Tax=Labrus bergylta TaxID=56723 RepID=A0A3Q3E987_9LABR